MNKIVIVLLFLGTVSASEIKIPKSMDNCASLQACMAILNTVVPAKDDGSDSGGKELAEKLKRFGDPAKHELIRRAAGDHSGWRNLAGAILLYWGNWDPSDVPELRAGLRKDHGSWLANPLGDIATPEAIQALVEDLAFGSGSQTSFALVRLGGKAVPYLFPLLQNTKTAESALRVMREIGTVALPFAPKWASLATDSRQLHKTRMAALKGIEAIGDGARPVCGQLHGLLKDQDTNIRDQATATLKTVHDPIVAWEVVRSCHPSVDTYDGWESSRCLADVAAFGVGARGLGGNLFPFLVSQNRLERADAITTMGMIDYQTAVPQIKRALNSDDWRVVYAAIRSLGWLGAREVVPELNKVSQEHWLPEVRKRAASVVAGLRSPNGRIERPQRLKLFSNRREFEYFSVNYTVLDKEPGCPSNRWRWKNATFTLSMTRKEKTSLRFADGKLQGTDRGEWGGELTWLPSSGKAIVLHNSNVVAIEPDENGAMVLFGSLEVGYVLNLIRSSDAKWILKEVARLPVGADGLASIGADLYAALSGGRVVVFSNRGIQGLATCSAQ